MAGKRVYIYRSGTTSNCALTGVKNDPRLPPLAAPDCWRFWMQIGPGQARDGRYGFNVRAAVQGIAADGYYLFTGSRALLRKRAFAPLKPASRRGQDDA